MWYESNIQYMKISSSSMKPTWAKHFSSALVPDIDWKENNIVHVHSGPVKFKIQLNNDLTEELHGTRMHVMARTCIFSLTISICVNV